MTRSLVPSRTMISSSPRRASPLTRPPRGRLGFTLVEVLIAVSLLGFSLIVMFGFHTQAVRSNMQARKITDCTYLAQTQMERLMSVPWNTVTARSGGPLEAGTAGGGEWDDLYHSENGPGVSPSAVNAMNEEADTFGVPTYYLSWDVEDMDAESTWTRLRVRCKYEDKAFGAWRGTTVSAYRYRDSG